MRVCHLAVEVAGIDDAPSPALRARWPAAAARRAFGRPSPRRAVRSARPTHDPATLSHAPADHGHHAVRRGGRGLRRHPRRAGRPDRHDAAAGRDAGRHRPAARALRSRQDARRAVLHLAVGRAARRFRHLDLAAAGRARPRPQPPAGDARTVDRGAAPGARHRRAAGRHRRAPPRHGGGGRHRRRQRRGAVHSRFPLGPGAHPAVRRAVADLRDFRPRIAAARPALRDAVLPLREHPAAALRPDARPARPHDHAGRGAGAAARRHHRAAAQAVAEGSARPRLCRHRPREGLFGDRR